jgi:hypothetical protein
MADWMTYSLADFLPFDRATYLRLFELYNARFWPAVVIGLALGVWMLWLLHRPTVERGPLVWRVLAGCWLWIAVMFHWESYAPLNWAARYAAVAFFLQGLLLLATGAVLLWPGRVERFDAPPRIGYGILVFAILLMPLLGLLLDRPWQGLEWFGTAPDPTVLATLGLLSMAGRRGRLMLMVVPTAWCLFSGLTLLAMDDPLWPLLPAAAVVCTAASLRPPAEQG